MKLFKNLSVYSTILFFVGHSFSQCQPTAPNDECATAPTIGLNGTYCGSTCNYTPGTSALWFKNSNVFCSAVSKQTVENNSFVLFKPTSSSVTFEICALTGCSSKNSIIGASGIQALVFNFPTVDGKGTCGSGTINGYYCLKQLSGTDCSPCGNPKGCLTITINSLDITKFYYFMVDGYEGDCCNFTVKFTSNITLPIELIDFRGEATTFGNQLYWTTVSERGNSRFEVESSIDGETWNTIGSVNGAGNSTTQLPYSFLDEYPEDGITYYRLRQVDFDENHSYSNVVAIDRKLTSSVAIAPNPFNNELTVKIDAKRSGNHTLSFVSMVGVRMDKTFLLDRGLNTLRLNIENELAQGVYLVEVIDESGVKLYSSKLVKN